MSLIELESVSYAYPDSPAPALKELSFSIAEGEYVAVLGANGSGKSSLLRLLDGLRAPTRGELRVGGLSTSTEEGRRSALAAVGLVFQSPADQIVSSSVEEDVAFGPENLGLPRAEILTRVGRALAAVGLEGERFRPSRFLSAGQQQRLAVAGALATDASCIAFDEATAMLDPEARERVLALMDELVLSGKAVVHVTHDMSEAARASRLLVLEGGALVFDGSPAELFSPGRQALRASASLELPECATLAAALGLEARPRESMRELAARIVQRYRARPRAAAPKAGTKVLESAFILKGASHSYLHGTDNEQLALSGVDLAIPRGARLALVGRTGSGKSTALQLLDGLVAPTQGSVTALGMDLAKAGKLLRSIRMRAPLAIQRPESALFERYSGDDVAFGPRNLGLAGPKLVGRVKAAMDEAGLAFEAFRDRPTRSLSGGEKRRLALAGVLAMGGEALLLDEPTSALDPATKRSILELLIGPARGETTVVMATHSMAEAARAELVAVFDSGRLAALGEPASIFYEGFDPSWGLRRPLVCELASELEAAGLRLEARPLSAQALVAALEPLASGEAAERLAPA